MTPIDVLFRLTDTFISHESLRRWANALDEGAAA